MRATLRCCNVCGIISMIMICDFYFHFCCIFCCTIFSLVSALLYYTGWLRHWQTPAIQDIRYDVFLWHWASLWKRRHSFSLTDLLVTTRARPQPLSRLQFFGWLLHAQGTRGKPEKASAEKRFRFWRNYKPGASESARFFQIVVVVGKVKPYLDNGRAFSVFKTRLDRSNLEIGEASIQTGLLQTNLVAVMSAKNPWEAASGG